MHESPFRTPSRADARGRSPASHPPWPRPSRLAPKATAPKVGHDRLDDAGPDLEQGQGRRLVRGADRAATPGSTRRSSTCTTQNLRFLNAKTLPNGAYFWRVRSVDADSAVVEVVGRAQVHEEVELGGGAADAREPAARSPIRRRRSSPGRRCRARRPTACPSRPAQPAAAWTRRAASSRTARSPGATAASRSRRRTPTSPSRRRCIRAPTTGRSCPVDAEGNAGTPSAIMSFAWIWAGTTTADRDRHGAGRRDLRPALPVGRRFRARRATRSRSTPPRASRPARRCSPPTRPRRPSRRRRRCRTTPTTGASAASTRRARRARGTTARRSTRPTTRPWSPARRTCRSSTRSSSRSPTAATSTSRSSPGTRCPARAYYEVQTRSASSGNRRSTRRRTRPGRRLRRPATRRPFR